MIIREAAQRLGKSDSALRRAIKAGKLVAKMVDGKYDITEEALNAYADTTQRLGALRRDEGERERLRDEVEALRREHSELERLRSENEQLKQDTEELGRLRGEMETLRRGLDEAQKRINDKDTELAEARRELAEAGHRHDTVVMQMTRLLEYHQQPFWRKLFSRKALPPPEQIMDMEPGDDKPEE